MRHKILIGAALAALAFTSAAVAQGTTAKQPAYDVKHEVEVRGKVLTVKAMPDWMGKDGVNLSVETAEAVAQHIDVAPASFLKLLEFPIEAGDYVTLTGSWGETADGSPVFLVHGIQKKSVTVNVRDPAGAPVW